MSECANSDSKRKKKVAFKGRPKQTTVVYLKFNHRIIPKGAAREKLRGEGRIKDVPFFRYFSRDEVKDLINEMFPDCTKDFLFLQGHKDNTLSPSSNQNLDGNGVIDLAKHGSLYLLEQSSALEPFDLPAADAQSSESLSEKSSSEKTSSEMSSSEKTSSEKTSSASANLCLQNVPSAAASLLRALLSASVIGSSSCAPVTSTATSVTGSSSSTPITSAVTFVTGSSSSSPITSMITSMSGSSLSTPATSVVTSVTGNFSSTGVTSKAAQPVQSHLSDECEDLMRRADEILDKLKVIISSYTVTYNHSNYVCTATSTPQRV